MTYSLIQGHESETRVDLLLQLTKITSEDITTALKKHLCEGRTEADAAFLVDVDPGNFSRNLKRLNKVAAIVEQIKELDWKPKKQNETCQLSDK